MADKKDTTQTQRGARGGVGSPEQTRPGSEPTDLAATRYVRDAGQDDPKFRRVMLEKGSSISIEGATPPDLSVDYGAALSAVIMARTSAMRFRNYELFIENVFCKTGVGNDRDDEGRLGKATELKTRVNVNAFSNLYAYELLKVATEAFLAMQCAEIIRQKPDTRGTEAADFEYVEPIDFEKPPRKLIPLAGRSYEVEEIKQALFDYLGSNRTLPYIDAIAGPLAEAMTRQTAGPGSTVPLPLCDVSTAESFNPCWIELLWSYWHEEGMLVQTINAISLRFQNKRSRANGGRDPLAHLELKPLHPLGNLLWGYIQDERNRLTVARRAYEYQHEYGLTLYGRAVPPLNPADVRSKFIEAFHNLLHTASIFYRDQSNKMVVPDAFPLLNALKEVHLLLAEGAHNQFGDLPWTARVEMLIQKWLLSRPEMERFLGGRFMVSYPEKWMGVVDQMKALQGWTDVSVRYFRDLAVFGEQLLLSIRWDNWSNEGSALRAENWANIYRDIIHGYIHAYRTVTGVDLSVSTNAVRLAAESYMQPSLLLRNRLTAQQRRSS